nr:C40 family peptidase [uncultured Pelagimonas sp.]
MMDRRLTPSNGRVAHVSLRGKVEADKFVDGERHRVQSDVADLLSAKGNRDRQLLRGETFTVLDSEGSKVFGFAERDSYVGWLQAADLSAAPNSCPTHKVCVARSYGKSTPGLKSMGAVAPLPFGVAFTVTDQSDGWAKVAVSQGLIPRDAFVPANHLCVVDHQFADPVQVAQLFLGTPYLWGGNSSFGIDCSGLVQAALLACGLPCPGDSDLQESALGKTVAPGTAAKRGDLFFWKGHVAIAVDSETLIHANAHHMAVAYEPIQDAISRIAEQGDGPVTRHARINQ